MASMFQCLCLRGGIGGGRAAQTLNSKAAGAAGRARLLLTLLATALPLPLLLGLSRPPALEEPIRSPIRGDLGARPLLLGQSAPLSGPSAQLGLEYRQGAEAWFAEVNRRGGIHGRPIQLISRDDRYEPALTVHNTQQLIEQDRVLALFGYVGTPTTKAVLPEISRRGIPLVAPLTGAQLLRQPQRPSVFNMRASYQAEIDRIVDSLVGAARHRIAVLYQADAFGDDGLRATIKALKRHGLRPVATAAVQRNSTQLGEAARKLIATKPNGVVIIAAYPSSAAFSRELQQRQDRAQLMNVSFVGTRGLQDALPGGQANGIGVSQVVPFPWNRRVPVVAQYQRLMRELHGNTTYSFTSLEGFLAARLISEGLRRAGPNPSQASLVRALESIDALDLGGYRLSLGRNDRQASDFVELSFLGSQRWEP
jgi:ABC-type branched-subunit amino acid transport system substrate-binding protein